MRVADGLDEQAAARLFAGALLYPADAVRVEFGAHRKRVTVDELLAARKRWGMSVQGVLRRLRDLQVIDETTYKWWCMFVNRAGWRTEEPGEEPREYSTWVETHAHRAAAEGLIARGWAPTWANGTTSMNSPVSGEIRWADLEPTRGHEINKKRSVVVLSANDELTMKMHC